MKNQEYIWLALATFAILAVSIFSAMYPVFPYVYVLWVIGLGLLLIAVFKVLQGKRKSKKKFKDWYEDHPKDKTII